MYEAAPRMAEATPHIVPEDIDVSDTVLLFGKFTNRRNNPIYIVISPVKSHLYGYFG